LLLVATVFLAVASRADTKDIWENMPPQIRSAFASKPIDGHYDLSDRINPLYLRGDFDGDGIADYAVLVKQAKTGKRGIAVWLSSKRKVIVLGAGESVQCGAARSDDLDFDRWRVISANRFDTSSSYELPSGLRRDAILIVWSEGASGVYYWKAGSFRWFQEGD
jgi:hypothetical protein